MGGTVQLNTGFMDDIEVDKSSGEWKYKGDYYWPVSGKLQFCYLTGANFGYYYRCRLSEIRVCGEGG